MWINSFRRTLVFLLFKFVWCVSVFRCLIQISFFSNRRSKIIRSDFPNPLWESPYNGAVEFVTELFPATVNVCLNCGSSLHLEGECLFTQVGFWYTNNWLHHVHTTIEINSKRNQNLFILKPNWTKSNHKLTKNRPKQKINPFNKYNKKSTHLITVTKNPPKKLKQSPHENQLSFAQAHSIGQTPLLQDLFRRTPELHAFCESRAASHHALSVMNLHESNRNREEREARDSKYAWGGKGIGYGERGLRVPVGGNVWQVGVNLSVNVIVLTCGRWGEFVCNCMSWVELMIAWLFKSLNVLGFSRLNYCDLVFLTDPQVRHPRGTAQHRGAVSRVSTAANGGVWKCGIGTGMWN